MRSNEEKWQDSLDLETVFHEGSGLEELEALDVKGLLKANGIASILVGDPVVMILSRILWEPTPPVPFLRNTKASAPA